MEQVNIDVSSAIPLFADQIAIATRFSANKDKKNNMIKQANIEFLFVDTMAKKTVTRVIVPFPIAKGFAETFIQVLKKVEEELKSKELPKQPVKMQPVKIEHTEGKNYFG